MSLLRGIRGDARILVLFPVLTFLAIFPQACGNSSGTAPQHQTIKLIITDGKINIGREQLKVLQGDTVTLSVTSDKHGVFHLHGYDHEVTVNPGTETELTFDASATGSFNFTFHVDGGTTSHMESSINEHGEIFESGMLEKGHEFSFTVTDALIGQDIIYHNHMRHEQTGSITVSPQTTETDTFLIEIQAHGAFNPQRIKVPAGSIIVWANTVQDHQRIVSGHPPSTQDSHQSHNKDESHETVLGTLEIHPR